MGFASELKAFEKTVVTSSESVIEKVFVKASNHIINKTPYLTGLARSNWFSKLNDYSDEKTTETRAKLKRKKEAAETAKRFKLGGFITLTNNLPYIERLENGWSKQAPVGMVKVAYSLLNRWIETEVRKLK